jgi:hypothetical protein
VILRNPLRRRDVAEHGVRLLGLTPHATSNVDAQEVSRRSCRNGSFSASC